VNAETDPETSQSIDPARRWVIRLAPVFFWLAVVDLVALSGYIHRADERYGVTGFETLFIAAILVGIWPIIAVEAIVGLILRDRSRPLWPTLLRTVAIVLLPPARLGMVSPITGEIWLPRLGWQRQGKDLLERLDRSFGLPLLVFALLVIPVLGAEYIWKDAVKENRFFSWALDACMAAIWVAFAAEFLLKLQASGTPFKYAKEKWLDAAIVLLPVLEFVLTSWASAAPIARLLRTTRAIAPDKLARMGQMYRLRGMGMKLWHALLALELVARVTGDTAAKRLKRLEARIAAAELELAELKDKAEALRVLESNAVVEAANEHGTGVSRERQPGES